MTSSQAEEYRSDSVAKRCRTFLEEFKGVSQQWPPIPDSSQLAILNACAVGEDVVVEGVAGSGLTTLPHMLAALFPSLPVLQIVTTPAESDLLKQTQKLGMLDYGTPRSCAIRQVTVSDQEVFSEQTFKDFLASCQTEVGSTPLSPSTPKFVVAVDNAEELKSNFCKLLTYLDVPAKGGTFMICGCPQKRLNEWQTTGAVPVSALSQPHQLGLTKPTTISHLSRSYGCSKAVVEFLNDVCGCEPRLEAAPNAPQGVVQYRITSAYELPRISETVLETLSEAAPVSIMGRTDVSKSGKNTPITATIAGLRLLCGNRSVPAHFETFPQGNWAMKRAAQSTWNATESCVSVCSFEAMKPFRASTCIISGVSALQSQGSSRTLPNWLYVAITRSSNRLVLIQSADRDNVALGCLSPTPLSHYVVENSTPVIPRNIFVEKEILCGDAMYFPSTDLFQPLEESAAQNEDQWITPTPRLTSSDINYGFTPPSPAVSKLFPVLPEEGVVPSLASPNSGTEAERGEPPNSKKKRHGEHRSQDKNSKRKIDGAKEKVVQQRLVPIKTM